MQKSSNHSTSSSLDVCTFKSSLKIQCLIQDPVNTFQVPFTYWTGNPHKLSAQPSCPSRTSGWFDTTRLLKTQMLQTLAPTCVSQSLQKQLLSYVLGTSSGNFLVMKEKRTVPTLLSHYLALSAFTLIVSYLGPQILDSITSTWTQWDLYREL